MSGPSLPAARVGDRIAHGGAVAESPGAALVCVALGALLAPAGCGGAAAVALGAAVSSGGAAGGASGGAQASSVGISVGSLLPASSTGSISAGSPNTFLGGPGLAAALAAGQPLTCAHHASVSVTTGSASVFVNDHPLARTSDRTACGALIAGGAATVLIGGAASAGPAPSPLAALSGSAARVGTVVGSALAQGTSAVERLTGLADALTQQAVGDVNRAVVTAQAGATALEARIGAKAGVLVGTVASTVAGPLLGAMLGANSAG